MLKELPPRTNRLITIFQTIVFAYYTLLWRAEIDPIILVSKTGKETEFITHTNQLDCSNSSLEFPSEETKSNNWKGSTRHIIIAHINRPTNRCAKKGNPEWWILLWSSSWCYSCLWQRLARGFKTQIKENVGKKPLPAYYILLQK